MTPPTSCIPTREACGRGSGHDLLQPRAVKSHSLPAGPSTSQLRTLYLIVFKATWSYGSCLMKRSGLQEDALNNPESGGSNLLAQLHETVGGPAQPSHTR